ncbi:hypothetical protein OSB04_006739 [Centaurea solstitialis]|uniref:Reverse transcriptase zinc-binding domain-containing protein n=1 Tax=Centaurea solstitialis TaxID=347529 RepID=A0AA38TK99_9ASTR|nr:hypothetical protein OSB04_006739 [Centaurea solstitialis]
MWVACHKRLPTQDRIQNWKTKPPYMVSVFCKEVLDSHSHLFFECEFPLKVWSSVKHQVELYGFLKNWNNIVTVLSSSPKRTGHRLALAASVVHEVCDAVIKRMAWKMLHKITKPNIIPCNGLIIDECNGRSSLMYLNLGLRLSLFFGDFVSNL